MLRLVHFEDRSTVRAPHALGLPLSKTVTTRRHVKSSLRNSLLIIRGRDIYSLQWYRCMIYLHLYLDWMVSQSKRVRIVSVLIHVSHSLMLICSAQWHPRFPFYRGLQYQLVRVHVISPRLHI